MIANETVPRSGLVKRVIKPIVIVFFSGVLSACAATGDSDESAGDPAPIRSHDCIFQSSIRDYQVLDDKNLIVSSGARKKYHVELSRKALGLRGNWSIGFISPTGRICPGSAEVIVDDGFGRKETIRLISVKELTADELDALLVQFGKKAPEHEQTTEPESVDGAEVEELD